MRTCFLSVELLALAHNGALFRVFFINANRKILEQFSTFWVVVIFIFSRRMREKVKRQT